MTGIATLTRVPLDEVADRVNEVLDNVDYDDGAAMSDSELLSSIAGNIAALAKLQAVMLTQLGQAEHRGSTIVRHGVRTPSWLTHVLHSHSLERARDQVRQAKAMRERLPQTRDALRAGQISVEQGDAVVSTLVRLPVELDAPTMAEAEETMLGFTDSHNATDLRRLAHHLVDVVAPEIGEADTVRALERLEARAQEKRSLFFWDDHNGGVGMSGILPPVDGARLRDVIAAITARPRPSGEDPNGDDRSVTQKRADALAEVVDGYLKSGAAHIQPWWDNGPTALHNGALVCPYHHRLVEPDPHLRPDLQWQLSLDPRGLPRVRPPVFIDPHRPYHQHARFTVRRC